MAIQLEANVDQFTQQMKQAEQSVKQLGSAAKLAESEFKLTGNAAQYQQQKTAALTRQIEAQQRAVTAARRGLQTMATMFGQNSTQAQEWQARLNTASTRLNNLQAELNATAAGTDRLQQGMRGASTETQTLSNIAKNARFQTLNTALTNVGNAATKAAQKVKQLGQAVWNAGKDSAAWADSLITDASKAGVDTRTLQQWQYAAQFVDTEVSTITSAMNKLLSGMKSGKDAFKDLGVSVTTSGGNLRDTQSVFWDCVGALSRMTDETERDAMAQEIFGKSFTELKPLIDAGRDSWEAYCDEAERAGLILSDEQVNALGAFQDALDRMNASGQSLQNTVMAELAPGFETLADTVSEASGTLIEWTKSSEGQQALGNFTDAFKTIAGSEETISTITSLMQTLGDVAKTASEHITLIATALGGLVAYGVGTKVLGSVAKNIASIKTIAGLFGGGAAAGGTTAAAGGTAASGGVMAAVKAIPGAVAKGVGSALTSSAAVGAIGFTGGIASVLGVGLMAKAMAGEAKLSDFGGGADKSVVERNRQRQELADERHQQGIENSARDAAADIVAAIEALKEDTDWRTKENRERMSGMSAKDITDAINAADLHFEGTGGTTEGRLTVETEVKLTGEAVAAALADGKITKHELDAVQKYVDEHFTPAVDQAVALIKGGWQAVVDAANTPPEYTPPPETELEVLEFSAMTLWVTSNVESDYSEAVKAAGDLWTALVEAAGSPGDVKSDLEQSGEEAAASGTNNTWNAMYDWVLKVVGGDKEKADEEAQRLWKEMQQNARTYTPKEGETEDQVVQRGVYDAMSKWVASVVAGDEKEAEGKAQALWTALIMSAGSPANMQRDLKQSAAEAKASGTNDTWNALVKWVEDTMGLDEEQAEKKAAELWTQLGTFATAAERHPELNNTYKSGETSTMFQDYADAMFKGDYEAAQAKINGWLDELDKSAEKHQPKAGDGNAAGTDGSTYLTSKVSELIKVKGEIETILAGITTALENGVEVDPATLARLEELMGRAEKLSGEVSWYETDEAVMGRGAMGLAMSGQNWDVTGPAALSWASTLREHELEGIAADIAAKETASGNAFVDWMKAQGVVDDMKRAGQTDTEEYAAAEAELAKAKQTYDKAQKELDDAKANEEQQKQAVEKEYADNIAEIMRGLAIYLGYGGEGKATVGTKYTAQQTPGANPNYMAELSGYAMGGTRQWTLPYGADTEAGQRLLQGQAGMSSMEKQLANYLYATYGGSYKKFMASLTPQQRQAMQGILNFTEGTAAESQTWSNIMFSAFGKAPSNTYYDGSQATLANPEMTATWQAIAALIGFKPQETAAQSEASAQKEAQATADALNAILQEYIDTKNETSGYNDYRDQVKALAEAGMFKGIDWSLVDGGVLEDTLADLADEAKAAGEQVSEGYGIGMESSTDNVINAGDEVGKAGIEGLKEGAGVNSPSVYGIEAGQMVDEGMVIGLQSGAGAVADAARAVAAAAMAAVRDELDIHSPSGVMEGLGMFTAEGFALGIEDSVGSVQDAVSAMTEAVRQPILGMAGRGQGGGNSYSSNGAIYIDTYNQGSAEDIYFLRDQLSDLNKRELQGFGLRR